jgi:flagellar biosynthesis protein FlhF
MKIKKFVAPDIRRAIRMVREEQGPDAVILSNRRVEGGVEIVSAIDYDEALFHATRSRPEDMDAAQHDGIGNLVEEAQARSGAYTHHQSDIAKKDLTQNISKEESPIQESLLTEMREELKYLRNIVETRFFDLEWAQYSQSNPVSAELIKRLINCGISPKLARDIAKELPYQNKLEDAWETALEKLQGRMRIAEDDIVDRGGIVALVGPTGVGKTTTVAKLAARYALRRGVRHAALITTDNYRVGAHEQLRTYGRLLDIPMRSASSTEDLQAQLDDLLDKDLILIDTAGMSQRDMRISEQLSVLRGSKTNIKVYLVIAATSQLAGIEEVINVFRGIELDGCIITKLDEATSIGPAVSAIIEQKIAVAYISDGQRVPEDLHLARADKLINKDNFNMKNEEKNSAEEIKQFMMGRTAKNAH